MGTRDKLNNLVLFDKGTYDKLYKEVPTYKLITPSIVSERLKVRGSLARRALIELMGKGLIKQVVAHSSQMIYTRMIGDKEDDDKEAEGGVVVERRARVRRRSKTPRHKPRLKLLLRPSKTLKPAATWFQNFRQCNQCLVHVLTSVLLKGPS